MTMSNPMTMKQYMLFAFKNCTDCAKKTYGPPYCEIDMALYNAARLNAKIRLEIKQRIGNGEYCDERITNKTFSRIFAQSKNIN